jgi:hypothetical protein
VQRLAHDGQPLRDVIDQLQKLTGGQIEQGYVDKEYEPVLGYFNARVTSIAAIEKDGGNSRQSILHARGTSAALHSDGALKKLELS